MIAAAIIAYALVAVSVFIACMREWDRTWRWLAWSACLAIFWPFVAVLSVVVHWALGY